MPSDRGFDDDEGSRPGTGARTRFREFDCEVCGANNPCDEFGHGDEIRCFYCGQEFRAVVDGEGRISFREV